MKTLNIGDVAARCGVSVKALRHFETLGLISPGRSPAGRRVYGQEDLARLQQVLALRGAGFGLSEIAHMVGRRRLEPDRILDAQILALQTRAAALQQTIDLLAAARSQLRTGETLSLEQLCALIRMGEWRMEGEGWNAVYEAYYSAEEMKVWEQAKSELSDLVTADYGRRWRDLFDRVEAGMAKGLAADSEAAIELCLEWMALQQPVASAVGPEVWNKAAVMYDAMEEWRTETVKPPFSAEVWTFMKAAAIAGRAAGRVPPAGAAPAAADTTAAMP